MGQQQMCYKQRLQKDLCLLVLCCCRNSPNTLRGSGQPAGDVWLSEGSRHGPATLSQPSSGWPPRVTQAELPSPATNPQNGDLANDRCFRAISLGMVCYASKLSDAHTKETTQLRRLNSLTAFKKVPSCWWISFLLTLDDLKENWYYCF